MKNTGKFMIIIVTMLLITIPVIYMAFPVNVKSKVFIYCGAGLKPAMDEIAVMFEKKYGVSVEITYGGIGAIASQFFSTKIGDVFIVPDPLYFNKLRDEGYVKYFEKILVFKPVIAFKSGNSKHIKSLMDLLRDDVKVGLGDPRIPAIGRAAKQVLENAGIVNEVFNKTIVYTSTVNELATYIKANAIDAAIVWKAVAIAYGLEYIEIDEKYNVEYPVYAVVLTTTNNEKASLDFINFLKSDEARNIFIKKGFSPA